MKRKGGVLATCDADRCTATHQVQLGDDIEWSMDWAGWEIRSEWYTKLADPNVQLLCPSHKKGGYPGG